MVYTAAILKKALYEKFCRTFGRNNTHARRHETFHPRTFDLRLFL